VDSLANSSFEEAIQSGGDERLDTDEMGLNKYFVRPASGEKIFNRASCTCSPLSPEASAVARSVYNSIDENNFEQLLQNQVDSLKRLINYPGEDRFDVFLAPSGSDLCYYQILFGKLIAGDQDIVNIVTCPEELGSGSVSAFSGLFHSERTQIKSGFIKGSPLDKNLEVKTILLQARSKEGLINDHRDALHEYVHVYGKENFVNANLVIGSKSGIENNVSIISQVPEEVNWTVDLCQYRASKVLINGLLGLNASVMLTGSKFYQSAPFCGALLVPKTISRRFLESNARAVPWFTNIFSRYDVPREFSWLREHLQPVENYGLLLRWAAAIAEIDLFSRLDEYKVTKQIDAWNSCVTRTIEESKNLELIPDQHLTNKTIVSFRVLDRSGYLDYSRLRQFYEFVCGAGAISLPGYDRVSFGQPVSYGEDSFIRIAIGASDVRRFVIEGFEASDDLIFLAQLEDYSREIFWK